MEININRFGIQPDSDLEAGEAFKKAIAECKSKNEDIVLTLEKGIYNFYSENAITRTYYISNTSSETECPDKTKHIGIPFDGAKNITLDGNGSTFIFHGKFTQIAFDKAENIKIKNITTDFSRPTMSEMKMIEKTDEYCDFEVNADSLFEIRDEKLIWVGRDFEYTSGPTQIVPLDRQTTRRTGGPDHSKAEKINDNTVRLYGFKNKEFNVGDILQVRDGIRSEVGFFAVNSKDIAFENVTTHYMHGLGFVGQFTENITLDGFNAVPNKEKNRTCSCFADSIQISGCRGKVIVKNGKYEGTHDDIMNVHGTFLPVSEIIGDNQIKVKFGHNQTYGFKAFYAGDEIAYVDEKTLLPFAYGKIAGAELVSEKEMILTTEAPLPCGVKEKTAIDNLTWYPEVLFENNDISLDPTRGILISSSGKTVVRNNRFYRTTMAPILIACDARSWYESGRVTDVLIENNVFDRCGSPAILIAPEAETYENGKFVHKNICIKNNKFILSDDRVLFAKSTEGIIFKENEIVCDSEPKFETEHCDNVIIE